jgi:hypothetical protein
MKVDDRTYFEEEQTMDSKWMWFFVVFCFTTVMAFAVVFLFNEGVNWLMMGLTIGIMVLTDLFILYVFKTMKLELALTKKGFHYRFFAVFASTGAILWNDVSGVKITKAPHRGYGRKLKYKYGEVVTMNTKSGVELQMKNGKKKFFSVQDPDAFKIAFHKLELPIRIE